MKTIIIAVVIFTITIVLIGTMSLVDIKNLSGLGAQLISSQQQELYKDCIEKFSEKKVTTFKITKAKINTDAIDDAIVTYTEGQHCGTAGCVIELCTSNNDGTFAYIPFGLAASTITLKESINNGMHDLQLNNDKQTTMTWDGASYVLSAN